MTNQEKFIEVFGKDIFNKIAGEIQSADTLRWFFAEYKSLCTDSTVKLDPFRVRVEDIIAPDEPIEPKRKRKSSKGYKKYDTAWYDQVVEDFFLSNERTKSIKITDDPSIRAAKSNDSLVWRFKDAIERAGLDDCMSAHKFYKNTCNECVVLENARVNKNPNLTYKLS